MSNNRRRATPAREPITPPAIAPVFEDFTLVSSSGVVDPVLDGIVVVVPVVEVGST